MSESNLQYPTMRDELIYYLDRLQDENFQVSAWVRFDWGQSVTPFDDIIHFLYDDTHLSRNPSDCIGVFLFEETEADAIRKLISNIDLLVEHHGWQDTDAGHLTLPEWPAIVEAARRAHALISPRAPT